MRKVGAPVLCTFTYMWHLFMHFLQKDCFFLTTFAQPIIFSLQVTNPIIHNSKTIQLIEMNKQKKGISLILLLLLSTACMGQVRAFLHQGWTVSPNADGKDAIKAVVPGTTFNSYVVAGKEKDPNFGDNIHQVDRSKYDRDFYYRNRFVLPQQMQDGRVWLCMNGVNRYAEVELNGRVLGQLDGFMQRGRYDITRLVDRKGENLLRVKVSIPRMPLANQGSPNYLSSGGWDWMPYVPGLNSGITDKVWLEQTGDASLIDPWVRTRVPSTSKAEISLSVEVSNEAEREKTYQVKGSIEGTNIRFEQRVKMDARQTKTVDFTTRYYPQLAMDNPKLWWPNGMGVPHLYTMHIEVVDEAGRVSDSRDLRFGVKEYSYDTEGGVFHLSVNKKRVFVKGANWGMSEYMLRCRGEEYRLKIRLHQQMHFNMIRNWLGSVTDDEFYQYCDEMGIMVWDDFWLNSSPNLPYDIYAFNRNAVEKIKRLRNHPCLAVWCGDNEGTPEPPLTGWLTEDIKTFDGGDRCFLPQSNNGVLSGSGYWQAFDPRYYFSDYPESTTSGRSGHWGFRSEIGTAVMPNFESLVKFMPQDHLWPIDEMWNKHYFGSNAGNAGPDRYLRMIKDYFGEPTSAEDLCMKGQLLNLESNKAMYEGWLDHIWNDASGILTWMGQSAYPSMVWQTYDYYYDLTGAYFGCRQACEPLHVMWNPVTDEVKVANTTAKDAEGLVVEAEVFGMDGKSYPAFCKRMVVDAPMQETTTAFTLPFNQERKIISTGCKASASSTVQGAPADAFDENPHTRWAARYAENEWLMVDLGAEKAIGGIRLNWEAAYGKAYKIQVSNDQMEWNDVVKTDQGREGQMQTTFPEVKGRYVRMLGLELGWWYGYSLWSMDVLGAVEPTEGLDDVHFIRLKLKDKEGRLISENNYWRGNNRTNFQAVNRLKPVKVNVKTSRRQSQHQTVLSVQASLAKSAPNVAFATRLMLVDREKGEQILPAIFSDNYFTLRPGETKTVEIEVDSALLEKGYQVVAKTYQSK